MVSLITRLSFCKSIVVKSHFCQHESIYSLACNDNFINHVISRLNVTLFVYIPFILIVLSYILLLVLCLK
uniref:G-protein coupled receptors family 1 profile domain-containing protein n=1 Tax=Anguilla anguilla TaxID=7936 RepID=A0A0E9PIC5_ANGAN